MQKDEKGPCRSHTRDGPPDHHDPRARRLRMIPTTDRQASRAFRAWTSSPILGLILGLILQSHPAHLTRGLRRLKSRQDHQRHRCGTTTRDARRCRPSRFPFPLIDPLISLIARAARRTGFGPLRRVGAEGHRDAVSCHNCLHRDTSTQRRVEFDASAHTVETNNDVSRRVRRIL